MRNVQVPDVKISVVVAGVEVARFTFHRVDLSPQDWEVTAAIHSEDARTAIRACLLAAVAELAGNNWEIADIAFESGGEADDQLELPF